MCIVNMYWSTNDPNMCVVFLCTSSHTSSTYTILDVQKVLSKGHVAISWFCHAAVCPFAKASVVILCVLFMVLSFCQSSEWCHFAKTSAVILCVLFHGVYAAVCPFAKVSVVILCVLFMMLSCCAVLFMVLSCCVVLLPKQRVVSCSMLCVLLPGVVSCCHAVLCHFAQTSAVMLCVLFHGVSMLCCPFAKSVSGVMLPKQVLSCCVSFFMMCSCCGVSFCQSSEWCHAELCIQLLLSLQQPGSHCGSE